MHGFNSVFVLFQSPIGKRFDTLEGQIQTPVSKLSKMDSKLDILVAAQITMQQTLRALLEDNINLKKKLESVAAVERQPPPPPFREVELELREFTRSRTYGPLMLTNRRCEQLRAAESLRTIASTVLRACHPMGVLRSMYLDQKNADNHPNGKGQLVPDRTIDFIYGMLALL